MRVGRNLTERLFIFETAARPLDPRSLECLNKTLKTTEPPSLAKSRTEIVGNLHHKAKIRPGEQVNLSGNPEHRDRHAIRVENGLSSR